jgi:hypothetical protein
LIKSKSSKGNIDQISIENKKEIKSVEISSTTSYKSKKLKEGKDIKDKTKLISSQTSRFNLIKGENLMKILLLGKY